jgi:hypothetical protein
VNGNVVCCRKEEEVEDEKSRLKTNLSDFLMLLIVKTDPEVVAKLLSKTTKNPATHSCHRRLRNAMLRA